MNFEYEIPGEEGECSYLPTMRSKMMYRLVMDLSADRYEALLMRGWRRFGRTLFRPVCAACNECRSLRVDIARFQASKSQRRIRKRNIEVELVVRRPTVTQQHLNLYNDYHLDMNQRRRWPFREIDAEQYQQSFLEGDFSFSREFQYRLNGKLIAIGLVDMTPTAMSSIYFYHDPAYREAALGTYSVLCELDEGFRLNRNWLYMGYYIRDCGSMNYKNRFSPHQILQAYVADDQPPHWVTP